jgi:UDP:flavonoid glycosyltransferase YjiC (YdhE family)
MRIVWLSAADARGHLMRGHVVRREFAGAGIEVEIVTTSEEGRAFLAALGTPSKLLSCHYAVAFDGCQNISRARTEATIFRYLFDPNRGLADIETLRELCDRATCIVNDFHPLLLVAGSGSCRRLPCPVVHVYGENLWRVIEGNFEGRVPRALDRGFASVLRGLRDRAHARVEHTFADRAGDPQYRTYCVPPVVEAPRRRPADVRASLGIGPRDRLAAVYLNPHFSDATIADSLLRALASEGFFVHAVGEGFASHPGFRPYDPSFVDVSAAADVLVSAPGMGAIAQARLFGVPFLGLVSDQPEQLRNLAFLGGPSSAPFRAVRLGGGEGLLEQRLAAAAAGLLRAAPPALDRPSPASVVAGVHDLWLDTFLAITKPLKTMKRAVPRRAAHVEV